MRTTTSENQKVSQLKQAPQRQKSVKKQTPRRGFLYQVEYCPNPNCIQIQMRTRFPELDDSGLDLRYAVKHHKGKVHPFYKDLVKVRGLDSASDTDGGYTLQLVKANKLFSWNEILPKVMRVIQIHMAGKRKMVEAGTSEPRDLRGGLARN